MEDHRLRAFCLIVEMKSFSKAAEAKFITQSAMSHLIKNLEDELGMKLLIRKGKTVMPTPAGRLLYEHAQKILKQYISMENDLYGAVHKVKGILSIGASVTVAKYLLPQVFYDFSKKYREVRINLSVSSTEKIINELLQGEIDIGIVEGSVKDTRIVLDIIAEDEIVLIASDQNPLTKKTQLTTQDIISQPFIMPEAGSGTREFINDFFGMAKIDVENINVLMTLGDPELLVQMVQSGLGISFVSKWSVFKTIKEGTIKTLKLPGKSLYRKFYLIGLDKDPSTMVARTFLEFIKGYRFFIPF
ncbi:MAG: selenium metabolism-associated LysR family transcriptional regulator [Thermodesulfovibrionales bacterium]